ncbi:uncharacterized protein LOC135167046 [Diachasmimorpha longicaudata]|uniref:uncharacterized protein LOC135167046 n=1 Tax=Diachasmimorpha longicaudata TaxID=58733 RepID=UPI0030B87869
MSLFKRLTQYLSDKILGPSSNNQSAVNMSTIKLPHVISVDADDEDTPSWRGIRHEGSQFFDEVEEETISRNDDALISEDTTVKDGENFSELAIKSEYPEECIDIDDYVYTQISFVELSDDEDDNQPLPGSSRELQPDIKNQRSADPDDISPKNSTEKFNSPKICKGKKLDEFETDVSVPEVQDSITREDCEAKREVNHVWDHPRVNKDLDSMKSSEDRSSYPENTNYNINFKSFDNLGPLQHLKPFAIPDQNRILIENNSSETEEGGSIERNDLIDGLEETGGANEVMLMLNTDTSLCRDDVKFSGVDEMISNLDGDQGRDNHEINDQIPNCAEHVSKNRNNGEESEENNSEITDNRKKKEEEDVNAIENSEMIDSEGEIVRKETVGVDQQIDEHQETMWFSEILKGDNREGINTSGADEDLVPQERSNESIYDPEDPFMNITVESQMLDFDEKLDEEDASDPSIATDFDFSDQDLEENDDTEPESTETSSMSSYSGDLLVAIDNLQESLLNIFENVPNNSDEIIERDGIEFVEGNNCRKKISFEKMEIITDVPEDANQGHNIKAIPDETVPRGSEDAEEVINREETMRECPENPTEIHETNNCQEEDNDSDGTLSMTTTVSMEFLDDHIELNDITKDFENITPRAKSMGIHMSVGIHERLKRKLEGFDDDMALERAAKVRRCEETDVNNILACNIGNIESVNVGEEDLLPTIQNSTNVDKSNISDKLSPSIRQNMSFRDTEVEQRNAFVCQPNTSEVELIVDVKESENSSRISSPTSDNFPFCPSDDCQEGRIQNTPRARRSPAPSRRFNLSESSDSEEFLTTNLLSPPQILEKFPKIHDYNYGSPKKLRKRFRKRLFVKKSDSSMILPAVQSSNDGKRTPKPRKTTPASSSNVMKLKNSSKMKIDDVLENLTRSQKRKPSSEDYNSGDDENNPHVEPKSNKPLFSSKKKKRKLFNRSDSVQDLSQFVQESKENPFEKSPQKTLKPLKGLRRLESPAKPSESTDECQVSPKITNSVPLLSPQVVKSQIVPVMSSEPHLVTDGFISSTSTSLNDVNASSGIANASDNSPHRSTDPQKTDREQDTSKFEESNTAEINFSEAAKGTESSSDGSEKFIDSEVLDSSVGSLRIPEDEVEKVKRLVFSWMENNHEEVHQEDCVQKDRNSTDLESVDSNISPGKSLEIFNENMNIHVAQQSQWTADTPEEFPRDIFHEESGDIPKFQNLDYNSSTAKSPDTFEDNEREMEIVDVEMSQQTTDTPGEPPNGISCQESEEFPGCGNLVCESSSVKSPANVEERNEDMEIVDAQMSQWTRDTPGEPPKNIPIPESEDSTGLKDVNSNISTVKSTMIWEDKDQEIEIIGIQVSQWKIDTPGELLKSRQESEELAVCKDLRCNVSPATFKNKEEEMETIGAKRTPWTEDSRRGPPQDTLSQKREDAAELKDIDSNIFPIKSPEFCGSPREEIENPASEMYYRTPNIPGESVQDKSHQEPEDLTGLDHLDASVSAAKSSEVLEDKEEPIELLRTEASHWTPSITDDLSSLISHKNHEVSIIPLTVSGIQTHPTVCQPRETQSLNLKDDQIVTTASSRSSAQELMLPEVITLSDPSDDDEGSVQPVQESEIPPRCSSTFHVDPDRFPSPSELSKQERPFKFVSTPKERITPSPPPSPAIGDEDFNTESLVKALISSQHLIGNNENIPGFLHISQLRTTPSVVPREFSEPSPRPGPSQGSETCSTNSRSDFHSPETPKRSIRSDFLHSQDDRDSDGCASSLETVSNPPRSLMSDDSDYQALDDGRSKHTFPKKSVKPKKNKVRSNVASESSPASILTPVSGPSQSHDNSNIRTHLLKPRIHHPAGEQAQLVYADTSKTITTKLHKEINAKPGPNVRMNTPEGVLVPLMNHQREALPWMMWRETCKPAGGILADDMGLGKTILTIALVMESLNRNPPVRGGSSRDGPLGGTLIVCPANLITQWYNEFEEKSTIGRMRKYHKDKENNPKILANSDVVITTYDTLNRNYMTPHQVLFKVHWRRVVLDEAHVIRNPNSLKSIRIAELTTDKRWCLTGTPVHNKIGDLYPIMRFLDLEPFNDQGVFNRLITKNEKMGAKRLFCVMECVMLRRTKEGLVALGAMPQLPLKTIRTITIVLVQEERLVYDKVMTHSKTLFIQYLHQRQQKARARETGFNFLADYRTYTLSKSQQRFLNRREIIEQHHILTLILRLRQICCHPSLIWQMLDKNEFKDAGLEEMKNPAPLQAVVREADSFILNQVNPDDVNNDDEEDDGEIGVDESIVEDHRLLHSENPVFRRERKSSKMVAILKKIEEIMRNGEKIVVVSDWVQYLTLIGEHLMNIEGIGKDSFKFYTANTNYSARDRIVECFNTEVNPKILLLSLRAGGQGLNLNAANHVIIVDVHWNPQLEVQAQDRVYRIGQTRNVFIHKFICQDTIEERIVELQIRKLKIAENVLSGQRGGASGLGIDELRSLFSL